MTTVLESLAYGVLIAQNDRFVFQNSALRSLLRYRFDELKKRPFKDLFEMASAADWASAYARHIAAQDAPATQIDVQIKTRRPNRLIWVEMSVTGTLFREQPAVVAVLRNISDRKAAEALARHDRERLELVARGGVDGIWDWDIPSGENYFSERFHELLGYCFGELAPTIETFRSLLHPEDEERTFARIQESLEERTPYDIEYRLKTKNGTYRWIRASGQAKWDYDGRPLRLAGTIADVTARRESDERTQAALKEKEVLLREVYHRVKNNLQVIQSLLNLRARTLANGAARSAVQETALRVRAMALVHEKLYQSSNLAAVNLPAYVEDLFSQLGEVGGAQHTEVRLLAEIDPIEVGLDAAVPLGLLLTELVTNCFKHAFPGGRAGEIRVRLRRAGAGADLSVVDTGIGLPRDFDPLCSGFMGFKLVTSLSKQLGGCPEMTTSEGTRFVLHIPRI